jgi:thermostable 8-oxoguanine DNA glycosylase
LQRVIGKIGGRYEFLDLPDPKEPLLENLRWGSFEHPLTPAFWVSQAWMAGTPDTAHFRLGKTLSEEVVFCLLGGYGAPAEIGVAAAERVCAALSATSDGRLPCDSLEGMLRAPLLVQNRFVRYRFPAQRAKYLARALELLIDINEADLEDVAMRNALLSLPGIGPKTASWIVRNRRGSDNVAILDVHIVRACRIMKVFSSSFEPVRHYYELERRFLDFCAATNSRASNMDAVMWMTMRELSHKLLQQLVDPTRRLGGLSPTA